MGMGRKGMNKILDWTLSCRRELESVSASIVKLVAALVTRVPYQPGSRLSPWRHARPAQVPSSDPRDRASLCTIFLALPLSLSLSLSLWQPLTKLIHSFAERASLAAPRRH
ncbi:hypothetical protein M758_7G001000 [Ceratodon purpureus]|nr:hypothetical protein M758_7G001000 [Ceratodon purpureus]